MVMSIRAYTKTRRAPEKGVMVGVRLQPDQLSRLDAWIATRPVPLPTRPEAIRHLIGLGLDVAAKQS